MALINCSSCGKQISDKSVACIHCGVKIVKQDKIRKVEEQKKYEELQIQNDNLKKSFDFELRKKEDEKKILEVEKQSLIDEKQNLINEKNNLMEVKQLLENEKQNLIDELNKSNSVNEQDNLEKEKLIQELNSVREKNKNLENKLSDEHKENIKNISNKAVNGLVFVVNLIRYFVLIVLVLVALNEIKIGELNLGIQMLTVAISLCPLIYKLIWKKINISLVTKIIIEIISPFIILILGVILLG